VGGGGIHCADDWITDIEELFMSKILIDKACYERGCACYDSRVDNDGVEVVRREWVGLTVEEKNEITWGKTIYEILVLFEAKLREKNT